ncbi:hypothetical protein MMC13_004692 [Lambiella insularis]|nr:hypothetical protein [Lambiella insularis]
MAPLSTRSISKAGPTSIERGCVTPVNIASLKRAIEGNLDYLDGYEDLTDEDKAKVRQAIADGHVADEDWRYDVEMNRPGKKGFRTPEHKQQQRAEKKAAEEQNRSESPSQYAQTKRSRITGNQDGEGEDTAEPSAKKKRARVKKETTNGGEAHEATEVVPRKKRVRVKKETADEEALTNASENSKSQKSRAAPRKPIREVTELEEELDADTAIPIKRQGRAKRAATKVKKEDVATEDEASEFEPADEVAIPTRSKKAAARVKPELVEEYGLIKEEPDLDESHKPSDDIKLKSHRKEKADAVSRRSGRITRSMRA